MDWREKETFTCDASGKSKIKCTNEVGPEDYGAGEWSNTKRDKAKRVIGRQ